VPAPVPAFKTLSEKSLVKFAVTVFAASTVTAQVAAPPLQAPDQPENTESELAVAVKKTRVLVS
jgi:hypothetical protein